MHASFELEDTGPREWRRRTAGLKGKGWFLEGRLEEEAAEKGRGPPGVSFWTLFKGTGELWKGWEQGRGGWGQIGGGEWRQGGWKMGVSLG
jgi:hypothetical protein